MEKSFIEINDEINSYRIERKGLYNQARNFHKQGNEEKIRVLLTTIRENENEIQYKLMPLLSEITSYSKLINEKSYSEALSQGTIPPSYSYWAENFAMRYAQGLIGDFMEVYLSDEEVLSSLMALGIEDIYKFYFFLLWLKDYVEGLTINAMQLTSRPIDDINTLTNEIDKLFTKESEQCDLPVAYGTLVFRLNNKKQYSINNPYTIKIIGKALQEYCKNHKECSIYDHNSNDLYYRKHFPELFIDEDSLFSSSYIKGNCSSTIQYFIFHYYMKKYLDAKNALKGNYVIKDFFPNTTHPTYKVDKDKDWTISRLLCISGMADRKIYYSSNKRALRDNIKGVTWESYKKLNLSNSRY